MKINVAFPATGCQKLFEIHDELKVVADVVRNHERLLSDPVFFTGSPLL